jgi:putative colanic acid biosynthesis glycosyltransferase
MKISVITIVYNDEDSILRTLESIPSSNGNFEFEVIVKDGGSNDNTIDIIETFSGGRNIRFESKKDSGIYDAMNLAMGFISAKSDYIIYMNSGDVFSRMVLSILEKNIEYFNRGYDVISFPISSIDEIGNEVYVRDMNDYKKLIRRPYIPHQSTFVKTAVMLKFKFNEQYRILADYDLFCRLLVENKKFVNVASEPLSIFLQGGVSSAYNTQLIFLNEQKLIQRSNFNKVYYSELLIPFMKWLFLRSKVLRKVVDRVRNSI